MLTECEPATVLSKIIMVPLRVTRAVGVKNT